MSDEELTKQVKELALELGADKVGIADATLAEDPPHGHANPAKILKGSKVKAAISLVLAYPDGSMDCDHTDDLIHAGAFVAVQQQMNAELSRIAMRIAKFLEKKGYNATPISPDVPGRDEKRWAGTISHRYIAQLAGVGEVGQSNLLLTPEWGSRVQLATVLTDAPLIEDGPQLIDKVCKHCFECVEKCPPRALARENYPPYNFNLNRCFWGVDGWARLTKVEEPPKDWVDARPTALIMVSKYAQKYPQIQEYQELATRMGFFPFCNECQRVCRVGLNAKEKKQNSK